MNTYTYMFVIGTAGLVVTLLLWFCYWLLQKGGYIGGDKNEQD